jgi:DNA-binding transcriptional LysR family regulator
MDLIHLRTFIAVAEASSLTRAADKLHISQPAVSAQLKALEAKLGVALFHRTGRGMKLTDAGHDLLVRARDIVTRVDGMARKAAEYSGEVAGPLRVGVMDCGHDLKLARIIGRCRLNHPELRVELSTSTSSINIEGLLDQELDAAFAEGHWDDSRLRLHRIGTSRLGIIAPAAWREQLSEGGWARLTDYPWVFQGRGCSYCKLLESLCEEHRIRIEPEFRAEAFGAVKDLVADGLAISVTDLDEVQPWIDDGRIFAWGDFQYRMPASLAVLRQRESEPGIASFVASALEVHDVTERKRARPPKPLNQE